MTRWRSPNPQKIDSKVSCFTDSHGFEAEADEGGLDCVFVVCAFVDFSCAGEGGAVGVRDKGGEVVVVCGGAGDVEQGFDCGLLGC